MKTGNLTVEFFEVHEQIIEELLSCVYRAPENGKNWMPVKFQFGQPTVPQAKWNLGTELFFDDIKLSITALKLRKAGDSYLQYLPIEEISSNLRDFVTKNFWYLEEFALSLPQGSLSDHVSEEKKQQLAYELARSNFFKPEEKLIVFPLTAVIVSDRFCDKPFFFSSVEDENPLNLVPNLADEIDGRKFPPLMDTQYSPLLPISWLGVQSPDLRMALKMRSAIMGALALVVHKNIRHLFSGRTIMGGYCIISTNELKWSLSGEHTPSCFYDIKVTNEDFDWMKLLAKKLICGDDQSKRQIKALEYFYRAWFLDPSKIFFKI